VDSQKAQSRHVDMSWKDLPKELCPFEQNIADVEGLKHPNPVVVAEMQVFHDAGCLRIANIAAVEVRKDIEQTYDGKHLLVELEPSMSRLLTNF